MASPDLVEVLEAGLHVPDQPLILRQPLPGKRIGVANAVQPFANVSIRHAEQQAAADMRIERARRDQKALLLQLAQVLPMRFLKFSASSSGRR